MGPPKENFEGSPRRGTGAATPTANVVEVDLRCLDGMESMMDDLFFGVRLAGGSSEGDRIFDLADEVGERSVGVIGEAETTIIFGDILRRHVSVGGFEVVEEFMGGGFCVSVNGVGEGGDKTVFDRVEKLLAKEGVGGGVGEIGGGGDFMTKFDGTHRLAVVGDSIDGGDTRVGGGDDLKFKQGIETLEADGEHKVAERTVPDVRADSDGVGVELSLEDGKGSVGGETHDRGEERLREGGLDCVGDVHGG